MGAGCVGGWSVGVVATYAPQINLIRSTLEASLPPVLARCVDIKSVDAFQGKECDVVIWSTVRSDHERGTIGMWDGVWV